MEKFLTKENVFIACIVVYLLIQMNIFATKVDLAQVKLEMANMKNEMMQYSDGKDEIILKELDIKYDKIMAKLERIK